MLRPTTWTLAVIAASLLAGLPAGAQRPSINALNTEMHRNRAAMCAKADADGDSYRPFVCDPRCDCIPPDTISVLETCTETSPGTFTATGASYSETDTCENVTTSSSCTAFTSPFSGPDYCGYSSFVSCQTSADCPAGETCETVVYSGVPGGACLDTCTSDSDCVRTIGQACSTTSFFCNSDSDCPSPWGCVFGVCQRACDPGETTCDFSINTVTVTLSGVGSADSPNPVDCDGKTINSNDALECINEIEAVTGPCQ